MRLLRVEIERFRGIRSLDWFVDSEFVCLIGPGDSTKTTIIDAIELPLSPHLRLAAEGRRAAQGQPAQRGAKAKMEGL